MTRGSTARVLPGRCGSRSMALVFALRTAALERIDRLYCRRRATTTGMMQAILIGESSSWNTSGPRTSAAPEPFTRW